MKKKTADSSGSPDQDSVVRVDVVGGIRAGLVLSSFSGAVSKKAMESWPNQTMPFLSVKHLIHREETSGFFVIQVQVDRKSTIYLTGIIIPCILMVAMTLLTFIAKDNYTKLGTSFTTLLMMAVYADQVKNSTPTHVQYLTWIDTFILNNLIINVNATVNSCLLILFEEREWDDLHNALGMATCYTSIPFVFIINLSLLVIGYTEGAKEKTDVKETVLLLIGLSLNLMSILALVTCTWYLKIYYRNHPPKQNDEQGIKTSVAIDANFAVLQRQQPTAAVAFSLIPPTLQMTHEMTNGGDHYSVNSGIGPMYYDNAPFQYFLPGGAASTGSTPNTHVM